MKLQDINKKISDNKYLVIVSAIALVLLLVIIYLLRHHFSYLSIDITEVNNLSAQLVSLLSLIIVSVVSISIGVSSNKKNSERQKLERKMEAYDKLNEYIRTYLRYVNIILPKMDLYKSKMAELAEDVNNEGNTPENMSKLKEIQADGKTLISDIQPSYLNVKDFYLFLLYFPLRYSHLFDYDYKSPNFKDAKQGLEYVNTLTENLFGAISDVNFKPKPKPFDEDFDTSKIESKINSFADELKKELV